MDRTDFAGALVAVVDTLEQLRPGNGHAISFAVAGGSQAGKSYFVHRLGELLVLRGIPVIYLPMTNFYFTKDDLLERGLAGAPGNPSFNFDAPSAVDLGLMSQRIADLVAGRSIPDVRYVYEMGHSTCGFPTARRVETGTLRASPDCVVLTEGLFVHHEPFASVVSFLAYIDNPSRDQRLRSRISRDVRERGYTEIQVRERWSEFVEPGHERWISNPDVLAAAPIRLWIDNPY